MIEFLRGSKNFAGVAFNGCFNIDLDHLKVIYEHYQVTGENLLDEYCEVKYAIWEGEPPQVDPFSKTEDILNSNEYNDFRIAVSKIRRLRIYDPEQLRQVEYWAKLKHESYKKWQSNEVERERYKACRYTNKSHIRKKVFDKHGRECLACGNDEDLTLDHIKPIARGGENEIENLQPLCKSCNSSKGTQTIDYR